MVVRAGRGFFSLFFIFCQQGLFVEQTEAPLIFSLLIFLNNSWPVIIYHVEQTEAPLIFSLLIFLNNSWPVIIHLCYLFNLLCALVFPSRISK